MASEVRDLNIPGLADIGKWARHNPLAKAVRSRQSALPAEASFISNERASRSNSPCFSCFLCVLPAVDFSRSSSPLVSRARVNFVCKKTAPPADLTPTQYPERPLRVTASRLVEVRPARLSKVEGIRAIFQGFSQRRYPTFQPTDKNGMAAGEPPYSPHSHQPRQPAYVRVAHIKRYTTTVSGLRAS